MAILWRSLAIAMAMATRWRIAPAPASLSISIAAALAIVQLADQPGGRVGWAQGTAPAHAAHTPGAVARARCECGPEHVP